MALSKLTVGIMVLCVILILLPSPAAAFGAGNIASISKIEGSNFRHGDIEDTLQQIAFLHGRRWTSKYIKRVYFGNWLRDYSQAVDVGSLKGVQKDAVRIIVWVLSFMAFGYATGEFEVTEERLGTYQAHEHIDNPKGYPDDAQKYDPRLRPPVQPIEYAIDPNTGMKNYVCNESGGWATSSAYVKFSLNRSIHFGRLYTSGSHKGRENDLFEALRCLGQALHTLEDFAAHSNYTELALRELGYNNVFPHVGSGTEIHVRGKRIYPLTTGTFGGLDFVVSVLGEAGDHVAQSEVDEVNTALYDAVLQNKRGGGPASLGGVTDVLSKVPGTGDFIQEARRLQSESDAQANYNMSRADANAPTSFDPPPVSTTAPPGLATGPPGSTPGPSANIPGLNMDPQTLVKRLYPILVFHDAVVRTVSEIVSKIPGLEKLMETIAERITLFVMALIAPFIQPVIKAVSASLKTGNSAVVSSSANTQYEDHFSNVLNDPAGHIASEVVRYVAPRIVYAWEHPDVPVHEVMDDILRVFHHPALRDNNIEIQHRMFNAVEQWVRNRPGGGSNLNQILSSESVKAGKNHIGGPTGSDSSGHVHSHGGFSFSPSIPGFGSHSKVSGSPFAMFTKKRELGFEDEPVGGYGESSHGDQQQGQYPEQQQSQQQSPAWQYGQQPAYGQPAYSPQGPSPGSEPYTYTMPTNYQSGYDEYQPPPPQGQYGQPHSGQYPPQQQGPYGGQYKR